MNVLKRKHARLEMVLMAAAIALAFLPWVMYDLAGADSLLWAFLGAVGAIACLGAMMIVQHTCLRCPHCGRSAARPYWKAGEGHEQFCPKCGQPLVFDDEAEE